MSHTASSAPTPISNPLWPGPCLFVPIGLECLLIGQPNQTGKFADLRIDYRQLPQNADPEPGPFKERPANDPPGTGAHLQVTLPSSFRSGQQQPDGSVLFPAIPNRWLIARSVVTAPGAPPVFTLWVLQSDFLGQMGVGSNSYPDPAQIDNTVWLGRAVPFAAWNNPAGPAQPLLRSVGPGSVSWVATYDNTLNALSFYDSLDDVVSGKITYAVLGWYYPSTFDPLLGVTTTAPQGFQTEDAWQSIMSSLQFNVHGAAGLAEAEAAWAAWQLANPISGGLTIPAAQKQFASQSLCHGMIFGIQWNGKANPYPIAPILQGQNPVTVAVGGTAVEALAAWMAAVLKQPDLEDLIVALQQGLVFDYLQEPSVFTNQTLAARFDNSDGGTVWLVAPPENADAARGRTLQTVDLTLDQTKALTTLNDAQAVFDKTSRVIATNISELFALVYKLSQLPPFSPDRGPTQAAIDATNAGLLILRSQHAAQSTAVDNANTALTALLGHDFVLTSNKTPRFHAPSAPTLMIAGAEQDTRMLAPGDDGGADDSLFCRFTGQTVSALTVTEPVRGTTQTIAAAALTSRVTLPAPNFGVPKELTDFLVEVMLFDTANARFLASIAYQQAGVTPTPAQLDALAATISAQQSAPWSATASTTFNEELVGQAVGFTGVVPLKRSVLPWSAPWTPLHIDWQITWYPTATSAAGMFDGWTLDGFEYRWTGTAIGSPAPTISGRSVLGTQIAAGLARNLADFVTTNPNVDRLPIYQRNLLRHAADEIAHADIVTEAMAGFGPVMLMRQEQMTQLSSDDPAIDATLNQASSMIGLFGPGARFFPLRSGHFVINRLWIIDAFGQILRTTNPNTDVLPIRSKSVTTPNGAQDNQRYVQVVPGIQQPARVDLDLLDANHDKVPTNSASLTSPICGWLLPNHLDNSVQVFDAIGTPLGEILPVETDTGRGMRWDPSPGRNLPYGAPPTIDNKRLLGFVLGLLAEAPISGDQALKELLDVIDISLWKAAPNPPPSGTNLVVLVGQPVAVVRARIGLSLDGQPAWDQSLADTGKQNDGGLTNIPITTYVGDIAYDGNGALGYFLDDDYSLLNPLRGFETAFGAIRGAIAAPAGNPRTNLARAMAQLPAMLAAGTGPGSGYLAQNPSIKLLANGPTHLLTVLMDPRGSLPAFSGILPVASVALPPGPVEAMNSLQANFRVGPLLVDPRQVQMPLPANVSGTWSWIARTGVTVWETIANIKNNDPKAQIPTAVPSLREGWLALVPPAPGSGTTTLLANRPGGGPLAAPSEMSLASMRFHEKSKAMASAPAPVVYQYRFDPDRLIVEATASPTLTITNPDTSTAPQISRTIFVQLPVGDEDTDLVATLSGVSVSSSDPAWLASLFQNAQPPYVKLTGPALRPLASLSITFQAMNVSNRVGTAVVQIVESFTGGGSTVRTIVKVNQPLSIDSLSVAPGTVPLGQTTILSWTVMGGSYVLIQPGSIRRKVQGGGPFTDSVSMPVSPPQSVYTVQLYTDDRQYKQELITAYVGQVSANLSTAAEDPIDTDAKTALTWNSEYAQVPLILATPSSQIRVTANGSRTETPGSYLTGNQSSVSFTLQAQGYQGPASSSATVTFNPVAIRWFRYTTPSKTTYDFRVVNPAPRSPILSSTGGEQVLTAYGPGAGNAPLVAYLGPGPHLQVQYMTATPNPAKPGDQVTVAYMTLNANGASLAIGAGSGSPVPLNDQSGQTTITAPASSTILVLTVTANGQTPVSSEFDLVVSPG